MKIQSVPVPYSYTFIGFMTHIQNCAPNIFGQTQKLTYCCTSLSFPTKRVVGTSCTPPVISAVLHSQIGGQKGRLVRSTIYNTKEFHPVPTSVLCTSTNCNHADQATHSENNKQSFCTPKRRNETDSLYFQLSNICFPCSAGNNYPAPG